MPKYSVIVPVYNSEKYLRGCIESITNQTFSDFELILIDDPIPPNIKVFSTSHEVAKVLEFQPQHQSFQ